MEEGYHPSKSILGEETLSDFIQSPISGDITEVPGIGKAAQKKLEDAGITTTFGLYGKFLMLKEDGVLPVEHCDRFWYWIRDIGIVPHRHTIVMAVAEKLNTMFPGIYDASIYEEEKH